MATKLAFKAGGYGSYTDVDQAAILASNSGLLNYMFGKNREGNRILCRKLNIYYKLRRK